MKHGVNHTFRIIAAILAILVSAARPAVAEDIPHCAIAMGVREWDFDAIPTILRDALDKKIGSIALPGEKFDNTDIAVIGRNRRLIFILERGRRWVIATEHGGRGYNDPIFAYDVDSDGSNAKLVSEAVAFPLTVCSTAAMLLGTE